MLLVVALVHFLLKFLKLLRLFLVEHVLLLEGVFALHDLSKDSGLLSREATLLDL